jgi:hypothetical protein
MKARSYAPPDYAQFNPCEEGTGITGTPPHWC